MNIIFFSGAGTRVLISEVMLLKERESLICEMMVREGQLTRVGVS